MGTSCELLFFYLGVFMALLTGMAAPAFYLVLGAIIDSTANRPDPTKLSAVELELAYDKNWEVSK